MLITGLKRLFPAQLALADIAGKSAANPQDRSTAACDSQSADLIAALDEAAMIRVLEQADLQNKLVADIGCGNGRHWLRIMQQKLAGIIGFDRSAANLEQLHQRFDNAETYVMRDNLFQNVPTSSFDVIVSSLAIATTKNLEEALIAWCRILKPGGQIIITDYHPLAVPATVKGFWQRSPRSVDRNMLASRIDRIKAILMLKGFQPVYEQQHLAGEDLKHHYARQQALPLYERVQGIPIFYTLHFKQP